MLHSNNQCTEVHPLRRKLPSLTASILNDQRPKKPREHHLPSTQIGMKLMKKRKVKRSNMKRNLWCLNNNRDQMSSKLNTNNCKRRKRAKKNCQKKNNQLKKEKTLDQLRKDKKKPRERLLLEIDHPEHIEVEEEADTSRESTEENTEVEEVAEEAEEAIKRVENSKFKEDPEEVDTEIEEATEESHTIQEIKSTEEAMRGDNNTLPKKKNKI